MDGTRRADIRIGQTVDVVLKPDQATGKLTRGVVARLLTNSAVHPRGIKVMQTARWAGYKTFRRRSGHDPVFYRHG